MQCRISYSRELKFSGSPTVYVCVILLFLYNFVCLLCFGVYGVVASSRNSNKIL